MKNTNTFPYKQSEKPEVYSLLKGIPNLGICLCT